MSEGDSTIEQQIISALSHPEGEEGLYLDNLIYVHEEEQRPPVEASELEVLDALKGMLEKGTVRMDDSGEHVIFMLPS